MDGREMPNKTSSSTSFSSSSRSAVPKVQGKAVFCNFIHLNDKCLLVPLQQVQPFVCKTKCGGVMHPELHNGEHIEYVFLQEPSAKWFNRVSNSTISTCRPGRRQILGLTQTTASSYETHCLSRQ